MTTNKFISSIKYLFLIVIFVVSGCTEKTSSHSFVNELPSSVLDASHSKVLLSNNQLYNSITENNNKQIIDHKIIWNRLFSLYELQSINNERIEYELQQYLKYPKYLAKIQQRAEPFLYFILDEIEAKKIPGELALLPIVESAFKTRAVSKSRASGLWQFMPATGRMFGLKQNWWYDGRNDIYTSTKAATSYLKQLSNSFDNNWLLGLASYNAGKGNIRKAIRKNKKKHLKTDYWSLSLRKETMDYVPRLLALAKIFANANQYNIPLRPIPNAPHFSVVNTESQLDLSLAATMAEISSDELSLLNPAFKQWSTDPYGPFHLLIHVDKVNLFKEKLAKLSKKDRLKWIRYKIKSGDNLGSIALKYKTSIKAIQKSNHLTNNSIRTGRFLLIPTSLDKAILKSSAQTYTVKKGDTFWDIAKQFSVTSKDIANWNDLSLTKMLFPGQKLIIEDS